MRSFITKSTIDESVGGMEATHSVAMNRRRGLSDKVANEFNAASVEAVADDIGQNGLIAGAVQLQRAD
jgi:hypothetical protein